MVCFLNWGMRTNMTTDLRPSGVHHIALLAHDIERLAQFYTTVLRLSEERRWPDVSGAGVRSIWLWIGPHTRLMLEKVQGRMPASSQGTMDVPPHDNSDRSGRSDPGWHVIAFTIDHGDRAAWMAHLAACQVPIVGQTNYTLYIEDPEHNRIGLSHWPDAASP